MREEIIISVRADGTRVVVRDLTDIGNASNRASRDVDRLKGVLGAFAAALSVNQIRKWADTWTSARGKVNIFTKSLEETNYTMSQLMQTAQDTRQPLDATVNSFHQMTLAASTLGASQRELLDATELVNKVFAIQGTTAQTARGGLIQFGQAMTEGIVRAQEYNSMINAMPLLLKVVAENMDGTGGSVAKLRQMMLDGELTSKKFFAAMMKGQGQVTELFERSGKTIGQAFTILDNAATQYVGKLDESLGVSQKLFALAQWGAENFTLLANAMLAVVSPLVIVGLSKVALGIRAVTVAAMANPFIAVATAVLAAVTALTLYRNEIMIIKDEQISLGDFMNATWDVAAEGIDYVAGLLSGDYANAVATAGGTWDAAGVKVNEFNSNSSSMLNQLIGTIVGLGKTIGVVAAGIGPAFLDGIKQAGNLVLPTLQDWANKAIGVINDLRVKVGNQPFELIKIEPLDNKDKGALTDMGAEIKSIWADAYNTDYVANAFDAASGAFDKLTERAKVYAEQRKKDAETQAELDRQLAIAGQQGAQGGEDYAKGGGKGAKGKKGMFDDPRTLENNLRRLLNQIQPMSGAVLEYERAQKLLNAAVDKGLISDADKVKYLELVKNHYRDIVDPIGAVTREMERESDLLRMSAQEREAANTVYGIEEKLRKDGIILLQSETDEITKQVKAMQDLTRVSAAQDQFRANSIDKRQGFKDQVAGLEGLKNDPSFTQGDQAGAVSGMLGNMGVDTANTQTGFEAQQAQYETYYAQLEELRQKDLISESDYLAAKTQLFTAQYQSQVDLASGFFGTLSTLQSSENSKAARIGKSAAIAQATIETYNSATKAFSSMAGIPIVGPALGGIAAAAAVAAGMANVNRIRSTPTGFLTGGDFKVGGSGGQDSKLVQFRATPGETVSVATPTQVRKGNPMGENSGQVSRPTSVVVNQTYNVGGAIDNRTRAQMAADSSREQRRTTGRLGA